MWYTHTRRYYSAIGKRKTLPSATTWMDPEGVMLSENKSTTIILGFHLEVGSKQQTNKTQQKQTQRYRKHTAGYQSGLWWEGQQKGD